LTNRQGWIFQATHGNIENDEGGFMKCSTLALVFAGMLAGLSHATLTCPEPNGKIDTTFCKYLLTKDDTSLVMFRVAFTPYMPPVDSACEGMDLKTHPECWTSGTPDSAYMADLKQWSHDFFTNYVVYKYGDYNNRLPPPADSAVDEGYSLVATKSTLVAIFGVTYVSQVDLDNVQYPIKSIPSKSRVKLISRSSQHRDIQGRSLPTSRALPFIIKFSR
jgi:hypothetical protein